MAGAMSALQAEARRAKGCFVGSLGLQRHDLAVVGLRPGGLQPDGVERVLERARRVVDLEAGGAAVAPEGRHIGIRVDRQAVGLDGLGDLPLLQQLVAAELVGIGRRHLRRRRRLRLTGLGRRRWHLWYGMV